ncbi:YegP family protein [Halolamina salifodinae]|uniref:Uncharacterized protein YegP (UPF0339 family) n=1 Tax=Halolamina salifodinae TaxID=1202767 RepID=A0A8T4GWY5_9EURY|nr:YegP family protein [Halolamina salifodinae]MBP1986573.1 uncharacterized protein YegP (UPF0339 family) [Halolamina salifodinae]
MKLPTKVLGDGTLHELYRSRIGDPRTDDEVRGYWLFALGNLLGTVVRFPVPELDDVLEDASADESDLDARLRSLRQSQFRFELYEANAGEHRFRLRHRNGDIVADGGEGYAEKSEADDAVDRFKLNAPNAAVEDADAAAEE